MGQSNYIAIEIVGYGSDSMSEIWGCLVDSVPFIGNGEWTICDMKDFITKIKKRVVFDFDECKIYILFNDEVCPNFNIVSVKKMSELLELVHSISSCLSKLRNEGKISLSGIEKIIQSINSSKDPSNWAETYYNLKPDDKLNFYSSISSAYEEAKKYAMNCNTTIILSTSSLYKNGYSNYSDYIY